MAEETVKVESGDFEGGMIINKADFDEKTMKLFVEKADKPKGRQLGAGKAASDEDDEDGDETWTLSKLMKLGKDDLIAKAAEKGLTYDSPDDVTKETIAQEYLDA